MKKLMQDLKVVNKELKALVKKTESLMEGGGPQCMDNLIGMISSEPPVKEIKIRQDITT